MTLSNVVQKVIVCIEGLLTKLAVVSSDLDMSYFQMCLDMVWQFEGFVTETTHVSSTNRIFGHH